MQFKKIGFIGLGLIGGSIAKAIKQKEPETTILALASRKSTIEMAFSQGIISNSDFLPLEEFATCDVLFLCGPVRINVEYLEKLKPVLSADCLLTDVGSVKGDISRAIAELGLTSQFIGGHPMAGAESSGYANATASLLENAYYILTATPDISEDCMAQFSDYICSLGALPLIMSPEKHDFITACISHLPHIIAASLVNFVKEADEDASMKTIAAGGFRDITRIASSSPVMWQHICATNKEEILHAYRLFQDSMQDFITAMEGADDESICTLFRSAKNYRDDLPIKKTGALPSVYEFYIDVRDEAGGIATIATLLAEAGLSIRNIGIVHNREFEQGVLRIEMYDLASMDAAIAILSTNYQVYQ